jgi:hypothetical protein
MTRPWEGCWQVVYDADPAEADEVVPYPALHTTLALRATGLSVYAGGHFLHIRAERGRRPPAGWPPTAPERVKYFRTATAFGGRCAWNPDGGDWLADHQVTTAADPRLNLCRIQYEVRVAQDRAEAKVTRPDGTGSREVWRRLSGPGSSPLAGAWESTGAAGRWLYLVTAGHYAVAREDPGRPAPPDGPLGDEDVLKLCDGFGANAGAILVTGTTFDHWPMVTTGPAGFEARKHETFVLRAVTRNRIELGLAPDGSDATPWTRIG